MNHRLSGFAGELRIIIQWQCRVIINAKSKAKPIPLLKAGSKALLEKLYKNLLRRL